MMGETVKAYLNLSAEAFQVLDTRKQPHASAVILLVGC